FVDAADQDNLARGDADGALHFLVAGMADQDNGAALGSVFLDLDMDFSDERAGGIDHPQIAVFCAVPLAGCDAVGTENHPLAFRDFIKALDENAALLFQRLQNEAVVDNLMPHIERPAVSAKRAPYCLDGAIDAGAETPRLGENYLFDGSFPQHH